ncbi:substrate-binding domain-containing protein [Actinoplanes sp. Pm04-4]|uniref:Substrate-binding domain-containing protein n=1 Tax=Paractinoplanes pyxinae TaxID=2997416 RepID=A0ABT4B8W6_9ACTN|nr:substrate-binding domain-containing protein [Actinoplanes pyxinae]MCY1142944.1 substrate-binding domain-containing protein [Actinoplanes pyxinae]
MALATLGIVVPGIAAIYEFLVKGRKRLGYRVQMDTTANDVGETAAPGALGELSNNGVPLVDPSIVLLRIENTGRTNIDEHDYAVRDDDKAGIRVSFPGRRVVGLVVTELSDENLRSSLAGLTVRDDLVELPKVPMNRHDHYKVLAALDNSDGVKKGDGPYPDPIVVGTIKGGVGDGRIIETRSRTGTSKRAMALIAFLALLVVAQSVVYFRSDAGTPLDCAAGTLTVTGSTAFEPVVRDAAKSYQESCTEAAFSFEMRGSGEGLLALDRAGENSGVLAFSDGEKPDGMPGLVARPIAFVLFTLVVNADTGVRDLTTAQIRRLYSGEITNWKDIGGRDVPVRLISRNPGSGTRAAFQRRVLSGTREPGSNSDNCRDRDPGSPVGVVRCARNSTDEVLRSVADTPGALGYSELGAATDRQGLALVRIDGRPATVPDADHGTYPFWETELGYTHGDPDAHSLAASFLRYLTNQVGADIIRTHGDRPCAELANPQLCHPNPVP